MHRKFVYENILLLFNKFMVYTYIDRFRFKETHYTKRNPNIHHI